MLKILTIIAPFVLKGAAKNPAKSLAGQFGFYVLFLCGSLFLSSSRLRDRTNDWNVIVTRIFRLTQLHNIFISLRLEVTI